MSLKKTIAKRISNNEIKITEQIKKAKEAVGDAQNEILYGGKFEKDFIRLLAEKLTACHENIELWKRESALLRTMLSGG